MPDLVSHTDASVDHIVAFWDGQPAPGHGGTGDVAATRERGTPVTEIWPAGTSRT